MAGRFTIVQMFEEFAEQFVIVGDENDPLAPLVLVCQMCGNGVCDVEDGDTMGVLIRTINSHEC